MLSPLSVAYAAVTRLRTAAYKKGLLKTTKLPVPVISIGNITAGGTGKTPLVARVSRILSDEGRQVCILTRGYERKNARTDWRLRGTSACQCGRGGGWSFWLAEK